MKSQTERIIIYNFHPISEMFTIYLPIHTARKLASNLCCYQSEYNKLTVHMPHSKTKALYVHAYILIE